MQVQSEADRFKSQETRAMAKRLANLLQWHFRRQGDQGAALGVFSIVGRGDGSIHDSYRQAEPGDNLQDYHLPLNALQPEDGPFYVWTRANRYERRGLLLPDITGDEQPGSNRAIYERRDLAGLTAELLLRVAFQLGHRPGLLLPQNGKRPEIVRPDSSEGSLLSRLRLAQEQTTQTRFEDCLDSLLAMSSNIEFAVVISDLLSCNWEERLSKLARRLELVVFQIVDPWDLYLPDLGQVRVIQEGQRGTCQHERFASPKRLPAAIQATTKTYR